MICHYSALYYIVLKFKTVLIGQYVLAPACRIMSMLLTHNIKTYLCRKAANQIVILKHFAFAPARTDRRTRKYFYTKNHCLSAINTWSPNLWFGKPLAIKLGRGSFFILKATSPPFFLVNRTCPALNAKILWHSFFAVKKPVSSAAA